MKMTRLRMVMQIRRRNLAKYIAGGSVVLRRTMLKQ